MDKMTDISGALGKTKRRRRRLGSAMPILLGRGKRHCVRKGKSHGRVVCRKWSKTTSLGRRSKRSKRR